MDNLKNELIEYLPKLIQGIRDIITNFHSNKIEDSFRQLQFVIDGLDWSNQAYLLLVKNNRNFKNNMNSSLNEINTALEKKDYILVADIFEYEIIEELKARYDEMMKVS